MSDEEWTEEEQAAHQEMVWVVMTKNQAVAVAAAFLYLLWRATTPRR